MSVRLGIQGKAPLINISHKNANVLTLQVAGAGLRAGKKRPPLPPGASRRSEESLSFPFFSGCPLRCFRSRSLSLSLSLSLLCLPHGLAGAGFDIGGAIGTPCRAEPEFQSVLGGGDDFLSSSYDL